MNMKDLLENAGLNVTKGEECIPYESISDIKLPFRKGRTFGLTVITEGIREKIDHINYIRRTAKTLTPEEFDAIAPEIEKDSDCKLWLQNLCKSRRVKLINYGGLHVTYDGILGEHSDFTEKQYKFDTGFSPDIIYRFVFDTKNMKICVDFDTFGLSDDYNKKRIWNYFLNKYMNDESLSSLSDSDRLQHIQYLFVKEYLEPESEFIPFFVSKDDGCVISHKKFKNAFGIYPEVTSPCYGVNIKKHPEIMERLQNFIEKGGYIKDDNRYLICQDRITQDLYLRRYTE